MVYFVHFCLSEFLQPESETSDTENEFNHAEDQGWESIPEKAKK